MPKAVARMRGSLQEDRTVTLYLLLFSCDITLELDFINFDKVTLDTEKEAMYTKTDTHPQTARKRSEMVAIHSRIISRGYLLSLCDPSS